MSKQTATFVVALIAAFALAACGESIDAPFQRAPFDESERIAPRNLDLLDDAVLESRVLDGRHEIERAFRAGTATFQSKRPFRQLSLMFDAPEGAELEWRAVGDDRIGPWRPVEVTWREDNAHVGRAILDEPTRRIELRSVENPTYLYLEFSPKVTARLDAPLARDLPYVGGGSIEKPEDDLGTARQLVAPKSLVIPRKDWGARNPNKTCGRSHNPYRMTIHHTASPSNDGGDPAKRMRQMQAFHIDDRGWCDIGYHFVVSQSGKIYQGRSSEKRTGAHVGGENTGNIGTSLIGNFEKQTVSSTQFNATTKIVHWIHKTYNIPLDRQHLKGHTEWPQQYTSCPGTNMKSRLKELANKAKNAGSNTGSDWKVDISANLIGTSNPYEQGSSERFADAFPGDTLKAEIVVTNASKDPIRDVQLGYAIETPYLKATSYEIQDDHPKHDKKSWGENDANSSKENPDKLGDSGYLDMNAFSSGESKRVLVELRAEKYSIGEVPHPDVRGWVRRIKDVYAKDGWAKKASTDKVGENLRDRAELDVLDRDQWHFNNTDTQENLEGWQGCCEGEYDRISLNHMDGLLAFKVTGDEARTMSPSWTKVDADTYDQLVFRVRSHDAEHVKGIYWKRKGQNFSEARSVQFRAPGDGNFHSFIVPLGEHSEWTGTIERIAIDPLEDREPSEGASGWYDVDGVYFKSSATGEATSETTFENAELVTLLDAEDGSSNEGGNGNGQASNNSNTGGNQGGQSNGQKQSVASNQGASGKIVVNRACSAAGEGRPLGPLAALIVLVGVALVRRRWE